MTPLEEAQQEYFRYQERGKYYKEQKKYEQALQEYAKALYEFWRVCALLDNLSRVGNGSYHDLEEKIAVTFGLAGVTQEIANCYVLQNEYKKAEFFAKNLIQIIEALGKHQQSFDIKTLRTYQNLSERAEFVEMTGRMGKLATDFEGEPQPLEESDETFKKLVSDFHKICSCEIYLLSSREVSVTSSGSCFIATAAYSTSTHPDLDIFREFRDSKLLTNTVGKLLVRLYYKVGPSLAHYVNSKPAIKLFVRCRLEGIAAWMRSKKM